MACSKALKFFKATWPSAQVLSEDVLDEISQSVEMVSFANGDVIVTEGATDMELYILISGTAVVTKTASGADQLHVFEAGNHFGEQALLHGQARSATISATSEVKCLKLGRELYGAVRVSNSGPQILFTTR